MTILIAALAGCAGSPETHFYTLTAAVAAEHTDAVGAAAYSVAVGPISLPEVVDRPHLVLRLYANRVQISEQHRWAGSLESDIARVIAENLSRLLGSPRVAVYDQNASLNADYRVFVDIQRFESVLGRTAIIEALWTVRHASGGNTDAGRAVASETVQGDSYDALVAAHGRALARISREIAAAVSQ